MKSPIGLIGGFPNRPKIAGPTAGRSWKSNLRQDGYLRAYKFYIKFIPS
jgi:hypothetical protein